SARGFRRLRQVVVEHIERPCAGRACPPPTRVPARSSHSGGGKQAATLFSKYGPGATAQQGSGALSSDMGGTGCRRYGGKEDVSIHFFAAYSCQLGSGGLPKNSHPKRSSSSAPEYVWSTELRLLVICFPG